MQEKRDRRVRRGESGFTLIELLIVVVIIALLAAIAIPVLLTAVRRSHRGALVAEGRRLHVAFTRFNVDNGLFPSTTSPASRAFNKATLDPLTANGYMVAPESLTEKLLNDQVTAYDSPNIGGPDTQFWAVLTSDHDASVVVLVAHTDRYPGHVGTWYDGLYYIVGSSIVPVDSNP